MDKFNQQQCQACAVGAQTLSVEELSVFFKSHLNWRLVEEKGVKKFRKEFSFKNFIDALSFTNAIGAESEEQNHHPDILTQWGKVTLTWWTHKIKGLHKNDMIMAKKSDDLFDIHKLD